MIEKYMNSGYSGGGASVEKPTLKTFVPSHYSAKMDLDANLNLLRNRAADLVMNSPLGAAVLNTMLTGVLSTGLKVFPRPMGQNREWARRVQTLFNQWAQNIDCDIARRNNFFEMQRVAFLSYLMDGDIFCLFKRRLPTSQYPYTLKLQLIEAQRVSNPLTEGAAINSVEMRLNNHKIINGIEYDKSGRMVAVWISNKIWNEPLSTTPELTWQRVKWYGSITKSRNILHICYDTRPEMSRGAPILAPVIESLKMLLRYNEAELTAAVIRSFFSLFFVQDSTNLDLNNILPENEPVVDVNEYALGSGTLNALPRGVKVQTVSNGANQTSFESFTNAFIKQIAAAIDIPFEVLMKNFTSSYSASRAALLMAEQTFKQRRVAFVNDFCQPIYEAWLAEMVAMGRINAPGFFEDADARYCYSQADWRCEKMQPIDETKAVNAAVLRLENGLSTYEQEVAALGGDFYQNAEVLKIERSLIERKDNVE